MHKEGGFQGCKGANTRDARWQFCIWAGWDCGGGHVTLRTVTIWLWSRLGPVINYVVLVLKQWRLGPSLYARSPYWDLWIGQRSQWFLFWIFIKYSIDYENVFLSLYLYLAQRLIWISFNIKHIAICMCNSLKCDVSAIYLITNQVNGMIGIFVEVVCCCLQLLLRLMAYDFCLKDRWHLQSQPLSNILKIFIHRWHLQSQPLSNISKIFIHVNWWVW